jgi:hypothetical protein
MFELNMSAYNSNFFTYSHNQIVKYNNHIPQIYRTGTHSFCWQHARKITGLRVITSKNGLRGLEFRPENPLAVIHKKEGIAAFAMKDKISKKKSDLRYGENDTGPYLNTTAKKEIYDGMCYRDFGDYANDGRQNITTSRKASCTTEAGIRSNPCWTLTQEEKSRPNASTVTTNISPGVSVLALEAKKNIVNGDVILQNYGPNFWGGYYCPDNQKRAVLCNPIRERYGPVSRGGARGRGSRGGARGRGGK